MHAMLYASLDGVSACLSASLPGCRLAVSLPLLRQGVPQDLAGTASGSAELPYYTRCLTLRVCWRPRARPQPSIRPGRASKRGPRAGGSRTLAAALRALRAAAHIAGHRCLVLLAEERRQGHTGPRNILSVTVRLQRLRHYTCRGVQSDNE